MHVDFFESLKGQVLDEEMIKKIQAESGKDVTEAKTKMQAQLDSLTTQVSDLQGQVSQRDSDLTSLKEQLTKAGQSSAKLTEVQANFDNLLAKYNQEKEEAQSQLQKQQYEYLARESVNTVEFSSNAAKETFLNKLIEKNLPVENKKLLGFSEYLEAMKEEDPGAFVVVDPNKQNVPPASFSNPASNPQNNDDKHATFGFNFVGVRKHE